MTPVPADLRLVPAALAGWAVVLIALLAGWLPAAVVSAAAGLAAVLALCRGGRWAAGFAAAAACTAGVGSIAALQVGAVQYHPLWTVSASGAAGWLRVELDGDPHPVMRAGYGGRAGGAQEVVLPGALRQAEVSGRVCGPPADESS